MSRAGDVFEALRDELQRRRREIDDDDYLRSVQLEVKFRVGIARPRVIACDRFSERNVDRNRLELPPGSRVDEAVSAIRAMIAVHRDEIDGDAALRSLTLLVKFHADGSARVCVFDRSSEGEITKRRRVGEPIRAAGLTPDGRGT